MTTRKGMKLLLIGAVALLVTATTAIADETNEATTKIEPRLINPPDEETTIEEPLPEEDLLISPGSEESPDNLVAPSPDAEGDVFILGTIGEETDHQEKSSTQNIDLITFPPIMIALFLGCIGFLLIVTKRKEQ